MKARPVTKPINGVPITKSMIDCLRELAKCPDGSTSVEGVMPPGRLAALVQVGWARRLPADRIGGCRYKVSDEGRQQLSRMDGGAA